MALELVKLDSGTLPGIADAIRAKTGETALLLPSQMAAAIGGIKNLRVETGTITPAEDTTTITIPCSDAPKFAVIYTTSEAMANSDMLSAIINNVGRTKLFRGNCFLSYYYSNRIGLSTTEAATDHGIVVPALASYLFYRAGVDHTWAAYYWEEA